MGRGTYMYIKLEKGGGYESRENTCTGIYLYERKTDTGRIAAGKVGYNRGGMYATRGGGAG